MATFYVVATPIGNLEDITLRALRILKEVNLILCEDTRVTRTLLSHYKITTQTLSYHTHSTDMKVGMILALLKEGKDLALVSDAGTPGISDPGSMLVQEIRAELPEVNIVAVPGSSALVSAISISGLPSTDFTFLGFLPHKKGRETLFKEITKMERIAVFYESPHRILKTLVSLAKHFEEAGHVSRRLVIAREITKMFEEVISGTPQEILAYFEKNPDKMRGEFVVMVGQR